MASSRKLGVAEVDESGVERAMTIYTYLRKAYESGKKELWLSTELFTWMRNEEIFADFDCIRELSATASLVMILELECCKNGPSQGQNS